MVIIPSIVFSLVGKEVELDGNNHPAVGFVVVYGNNGGKIWKSCTSALISSEWAISAGQCMFNPLTDKALIFFNQVIPKSSILTFLDGKAFGGIEVTHEFGHPLYNALDYDVGVYHLLTPVTNIAPMFLSSFSKDDLLNGKEVYMIGYGRNTDGGSMGTYKGITKFVDDDGNIKRRIVSTTYKPKDLEPEGMDYQCDMFNFINNGNSGICGGDAGSPAIDPENGGIVGINVHGFGSPTNCLGHGFAISINDPDVKEFLCFPSSQSTSQAALCTTKYSFDISLPDDH